MDLTAAISNFQSAQALSAVEMKVARKVLDMQELQGAAAVKLIEAAAQSAGQAGDSLVAAAVGLGGSIDTYG